MPAVSPLPASLIIDDGAPVNLMDYLKPADDVPFLIPGAFTRRFADLCREYGVRGKFTVMPVPSALGRIDRPVPRIPARLLREFLRDVRRGIAPAFDITPEILTHQQKLRLPDLGPTHIYEDEWVAHATVKEMVPYFVLALQILKNVHLPATGFTSPWMTGITNEDAYAEAMGRAQWQVHRRRFTWYFLHILDRGQGGWPTVRWKNRNLTVVMVPATTGDPFWGTQTPGSLRQRRASAMAGVDQQLSADGRRGRMIELLAQGNPIVPVTHWQSLFSNGTQTGLWGFETLLERMRRRLGDRIEWMRCSDLAHLAVKRTAGSASGHARASTKR